MSAIERRLVVLEQAAKLLAARPDQHISSAGIEKIWMVINEVMSRPPSQKTQEEQIADMKANLVAMDKDWKLRHGEY